MSSFFFLVGVGWLIIIFAGMYVVGWLLFLFSFFSRVGFFGVFLGGALDCFFNDWWVVDWLIG